MTIRSFNPEFGYELISVLPAECFTCDFNYYPDFAGSKIINPKSEGEVINEILKFAN